MPTKDIEFLSKNQGKIEQKNISRLEVVKEFDHQDEVIKCRQMPQVNEKGLVASMTNSGAINLYNIPELSGTASGDFDGSQNEVQRLEKQLTGLEEESFALSWNRQKKGLLCSTS